MTNAQPLSFRISSQANTNHYLTKYNHPDASLGNNLAGVVSGETSAYWRLQFHADQGNYSVFYKDTSDVLDLRASGTEPGTQVIVYPNYNTNNQRWKFHEIGKGIYILANVHSPNLELCATGSSPMIEAYGQANSTTRLDHQWKFTQV